MVFSTLYLLLIARSSGATLGSTRAANLKSLVFITAEGTYANGVTDIFNGTGFIVDRAGYVLTCNHVIPLEKPEYVKYELIGRVGSRHQLPYPLTIIHRDEQGDLILLKLPENPEQSWRSVESIHQAQIGTHIVALGFPGDQDVVGVEGSINGLHKDGRWLTDAGLDRGMSGGPVFDLDGAVVGIVAGAYEEAKSLGLVIPISFSASLLQIVNSPLMTLTPTSTPTPSVSPSPTASPTQAASAQSQGRRVIELCDFLVDPPTADKDEPMKVLTRKITRLSERVLTDCSVDLFKDQLLNVGKLEVQKSDRFSGFMEMADFWHKNTLVLEIIDGNISTKKDPSMMWSDVHLFGLKGSLKEATITIPTEMTGPNLGSVEDLHCAVALYALAMDLKLRYPSLTDNKEKRRYIAIISLYLAKIPGYLPPSAANANELPKDQEQLSNELREAAVKELDWCKKERGNL
jgi:hypothetical protein